MSGLGSTALQTILSGRKEEDRREDGGTGPKSQASLREWALDYDQDFLAGPTGSSQLDLPLLAPTPSDDFDLIWTWIALFGSNITKGANVLEILERIELRMARSTPVARITVGPMKIGFTFSLRIYFARTDSRESFWFALANLSRAAKQGAGSNRGVSRSGLVLFVLFLSFFCPFGTFPIFLGFSRFAGDGPGIFPIRPFALSRPIKSTYEKRSATQSGPFPKKVGNPSV